MTQPHAHGAPTSTASNGGFFEQASTAHFSMCFNEGKDGWLGLSQTSPADHEANALQGFGTAHWGVGLNGISIGRDGSLLENAVKVTGLCDKAESNEQASNCGAIPDSGTTLITAPKAHL